MITKVHMEHINRLWTTQAALEQTYFNHGHLGRLAIAIKNVVGIPLPPDIGRLELHFSLKVDANPLSRPDDQACIELAWAPRHGVLAVDAGDLGQPSFSVAALNNDSCVQNALRLLDICSDELLMVRAAVIFGAGIYGYSPSAVDHHHLAVSLEYEFGPGQIKCGNPSCPKRWAC